MIEHKIVMTMAGDVYGCSSTGRMQSKVSKRWALAACTLKCLLPHWLHGGERRINCSIDINFIRNRPMPWYERIGSRDF